MRRIQVIFSGRRALAVPLRLPKPEWRPLRLCSAFFLVRALEWTATGLRMIKPSLTNLRTFCPIFNLKKNWVIHVFKAWSSISSMICSFQIFKWHFSWSYLDGQQKNVTPISLEPCPSWFANQMKKVKKLLELALEISLVSFGSNQILFLPHLSTTEARRFCNLRELKID